MEITRRNLLGAAAAAGVAAAMGGVAVAEEAPTAVGDGVACPWNGPGSAAGDWNGTPADLVEKGYCTMPLEELNRRRQLYIDYQTEWTCADGTVIPEVYVKARAVLNSYGFGVGNELHDHIFDLLLHDLTEEEAECYVNMPLGKRFTAVEMSEKTGWEAEECERLCNQLFEKAWVGRIVNDLGTLYYHIPFVQGVGEYHTPELARGTVEPGMVFGGADSLAGADLVLNCFYNVGAPFVNPVPCSPDIVKGDGIRTCDDLVKVWSQKNKFSLSPCFCRTIFGLPYGLDMGEYPDGDWDLEGSKSVICEHDLYTCLSCGEEAQFWIDHGVGKEITYEEAMERLQKSVDQGMIIEATNSIECETICSCHGDCCGAMSLWRAAGPEGRAFSKNMSHYYLEVSQENCLKCGLCAQRCPMGVIEMDEESGFPVIGGDHMCMTCGQCAYVCPTESRWLMPKPEGSYHERFTDIIDQNNMIAAERFEQGLIW